MRSTSGHLSFDSCSLSGLFPFHVMTSRLVGIKHVTSPMLPKLKASLPRISIHLWAFLSSLALTSTSESQKTLKRTTENIFIRELVLKGCPSRGQRF